MISRAKDNQLQFVDWNSGISSRNGYGLLNEDQESTGITVLQSDINGDPYPAEENGRKIVAFWNSYHKNCGDRAVECAKSDLLGECLEVLRAWVNHEEKSHGGIEIGVYNSYYDALEQAKAILAKRKGERNG